jgi:multiple sugar transport system ATP-binding protein
LRNYANRSVVVGIRPEDLPLLRTDDAATDPASAVFEGNVDLVEALGSELLVHFTTDAHPVEVADIKHEDAEGLSEGVLVKGGEGVARVAARAKIATGSRARFQLDPGQIHFFDPTTSEAIAN